MKTPSPRAFVPKIDVKNPHSIGGSEMRRFYGAMCGGKWTLTADWLPDWAEWPRGADRVPDWAFKALGEFCRCCYEGLRNKSLGYLGLVRFSKAGSPMQQDGGIQDEFCESDFVDFQKPKSL